MNTEKFEIIRISGVAIGVGFQEVLQDGSGLYSESICETLYNTGNDKKDASASEKWAIRICNALNASGWISCEDRLPENDDGIMLFTEEEGVFQGWAEEDEDTGKHNNFYFGGNQRAYGVTYWMPLPAAPLVNNLNN